LFTWKSNAHLTAHQSRVLAEWMNGFDCSFHHQFCTHID
jgi:hypothetical protein